MSESDLSGRLFGPGDRTPAAAVVDQRVDRFLQHALFVLDDDLGRVELEQPLEPVVAIDDAAIEIVEVGRGEAAAVELHHRAQLGRDHRHGREHHPLRTVAAGEECFDDLEPLDRLEPLLPARLLELFAQVFLQLAQVEVAQQLANRFGAHAGLEAIAELLARFAVLLLGEHLALGQRRVARIDHDVGREVDDLLELARRHVEQDADAARHALEVPDVADRRRELDVAHALAAHLGARDLDAAAIADHALEADALVLAAVALPVFGRAEDLLAEEAVALGLERAVVDRLGLLDFAERPSANLLRRREADAHCVEVVDVDEIQRKRLRPARVAAAYAGKSRLTSSRKGSHRRRWPGARNRVYHAARRPQSFRRKRPGAHRPATKPRQLPRFVGTPMIIGIVGSERPRSGDRPLLRSGGHKVTFGDPIVPDRATRAAAALGAQSETPYSQAMKSDLLRPRGTARTGRPRGYGRRFGCRSGDRRRRRGRARKRAAQRRRAARAQARQPSRRASPSSTCRRPARTSRSAATTPPSKVLLNKALRERGCVTTDRGPLSSAPQLEPRIAAA